VKESTTDAMKTDAPIVRLRLAAFVLTLAAAPQCHAYIDPNTGGFIYQLLFPLIVTVAAGWRWVKLGVGSAWGRLVCRIKGRQPSVSANASGAKAQDAPEEP
jgi:hypothetical protein